MITNTGMMITIMGVSRLATVAEVERELEPRVAAACDALQLPDGGSADLRRMAERTLLAVSLVLTGRMQLATTLQPP